MIKNIVKAILKDNNNTDYKQVGEFYLSHHDRTHLLVSKLPRILILGKYVSGIHGVPIKEFGLSGSLEYDGLLDECRVGIHQGLVDTTVVSKVRLVYWLGWLYLRGDNPLRVLLHHVRSMN